MAPLSNAFIEGLPLHCEFEKLNLMVLFTQIHFTTLGCLEIKPIAVAIQIDC